MISRIIQQWLEEYKASFRRFYSVLYEEKSSFTSTISRKWSIILYEASGLYEEVMKVRKKGKEIIRPKEFEIMEYLNDGWGICNNCGALMKSEAKRS